MQIKSSTTLRNNYGSISSLAHQTQEPIFITKNGEGDLVVMSVEAYEERDKVLKHREAVLESELSRLSGEKVFTIKEMKNRLKEIYTSAKV
ncbi:MAG: type II toxin-antitoxin system Phd/YefM family antitoxin [Spirochaetales bacterium]|nr:type II toxin-antitoxin system Phd/YefM family antitoxin [Spirochaetales bacterium]